MKKLSVLFLFLMLFMLVSINTKANYEIALKISFYDANLEKAIRHKLNKTQGVLNKTDVLEITELDLSNQNISDLRGLEELIYLKELNLSKNDLNPSTLNVLGNLIYLEDLNLRETGITNITFLRNLLLLEKLNLHSNPISSLKPIHDLVNLEELILRNVPIGEQLIYLDQMTKLKRLNVRNTNISDFTVIVDLLKRGALQKDNSSLDIIDNPGLNQAIPSLLPYWDNISERNPLKIDTILPPSVSHESGFYTEAFLLELKTSQPDHTIYYTTDGSEPDPSNIRGTTYYIKQSYPYGVLEKRDYQTNEYKNPIYIYDKSINGNQLANINTTFNDTFYKPSTNLFKANTIRVKECSNTGMCSETLTYTYFVHPNMNTYYHLPIVSITTNEDDFFGYENGIYVPGKIYNDWKKKNPFVNSDGASPANYNQRGDDWERIANVSFFETDGTLGFSQEVGLSVQGAWSRTFPRKSLRIYARSEYDDKPAIYYEIFPNLTKKSNPTKPITDFKRLILRTGGTLADSQFFSDALMQNLVSHLSFDTQAYRPAIQFINGEYWGIINIRERYDEYYLKSHYGIEEDQAIIIANDSEVEVGNPGDANEMINLRNYVLSHDMTKAANYNYVKSKLDIQNFIEYNIANIYFANTDWPGNNVRYWKMRTTTPDFSVPGHDGRWRYMLFDTDFGFGNIMSSYNHETLPFATQSSHNNWPNPAWSTILFRKCLDNPEFKQQFINTFADQLNTSFKPKRVEKMVFEMYNELKYDLDNHIKRWNSGYLDPYRLIDFGNKRSSFMFDHINSFFHLNGTVEINLRTNETSTVDMGHIKINSIDIMETTPGIVNDLNFTGKYFKNKEITITAVPHPGYQFVGWEGIPVTNNSLSISPNTNLSFTALFSEDPNYSVEFYDPNLKNALSAILNKDMITIKDLSSLTNLNLNNKNIQNLEGLQYAVNLTHLDLGNNNITSLRPIQHLNNLEYLNLDSNLYIDSLDLISKYESLNDLNLNHISIGQNIDFMTNLTHLNRLSLKNTGIYDVNFLIPMIEAGAFKERDDLNLSQNPIKNLDLLNSYYPPVIEPTPPTTQEKEDIHSYLYLSLITIPLPLIGVYMVIKHRKRRFSNQ